MRGCITCLQVGTKEVQEAVSEWFSQALGVKCWLVQQQVGSRRAVDQRLLAGGLLGMPEQSPRSDASDEAAGISQSGMIGELGSSDLP